MMDIKDPLLDAEYAQLPSTSCAYPEPMSSLPAILAAADTQRILRVTLTGQTLLFTILALIFSVHFLSPNFTAILISIAPLPYIVHNDYKAFVSLGPGGTPTNWTGYLKLTILRFFTLSDIYTPPPILAPICPATGRFGSSRLPQRRGPRPKIAGIAPQRQLNQPGDLNTYLSLRRALISVAERHQNLRTGVSCFEKNGLALFATAPLNNTCNGEIVHVHHSDRSMHMNMHPQDAAVVLEKGWGQRHPLAKGGWMRRYVPKEFMMVYAPRDSEELEVVAKIVEAAAWWVAGDKVEILITEVEAGKQKIGA